MTISAEFACELCGRSFEKGWSDADACAEFVALFGRPPDPTLDALVCDDCFKRTMGRSV